MGWYLNDSTTSTKYIFPFFSIFYSRFSLLLLLDVHLSAAVSVFLHVCYAGIAGLFRGGVPHDVLAGRASRVPEPLHVQVARGRYQNDGSHLGS